MSYELNSLFESHLFVLSSSPSLSLGCWCSYLVHCPTTFTQYWQLTLQCPEYRNIYSWKLNNSYVSYCNWNKYSFFFCSPWQSVFFASRRRSSVAVIAIIMFTTAVMSTCLLTSIRARVSHSSLTQNQGWEEWSWHPEISKYELQSGP